MDREAWGCKESDMTEWYFLNGWRECFLVDKKCLQIKKQEDQCIYHLGKKCKCIWQYCISSVYIHWNMDSIKTQTTKKLTNFNIVGIMGRNDGREDCIHFNWIPIFCFKNRGDIHTHKHKYFQNCIFETTGFLKNIFCSFLCLKYARIFKMYKMKCWVWWGKFA